MGEIINDISIIVFLGLVTSLEEGERRIRDVLDNGKVEMNEAFVSILDLWSVSDSHATILLLLPAV